MTRCPPEKLRPGNRSGKKGLLREGGDVRTWKRQIAGNMRPEKRRGRREGQRKRENVRNRNREGGKEEGKGSGGGSGC